MLLRHVLAVAVISAGAIIGALAFFVPKTLIPTFVERADDSDATLARAPFSLGNPLAAATLQLKRLFAPDDADASPADRAHTLTHTVYAESGDTLAGLLINAGVGREDAHAAITAAKGLYNPRAIKPGQEVAVTFRLEGAEAEGTFQGFALAPDFSRRIEVARTESGFAAAEIRVPLVRDLVRASGTIEKSLYVDATKAEVPAPVLAEVIRAFSWDVDFQRDIQPSDGFEVLYEGVYDGQGALVHHGRIAFASLTLSGQAKTIYRYTAADGDTDYYDAKGQSVRKALLRTPIDGARLSSGYGRRLHPILGYTLMHRGVDFAAPTGTPIYAAGDGTIAVAGLNGAYGKYVQIKHSQRYATAYAHMSRFGRGITAGKRVRQGEIIGYVGTTGRSTGPHLHYEVLVAGQQTNPINVKFPSGRTLDGRELARFRDAKAAIEKKLAERAKGTAVAEGESEQPPMH